jgi:phage FluMu gp28-like protein
MSAMSEALTLHRAVAATGLGALLAALALATSAPAASTTACDLSKDGRKLGTTYVTSLKVEHVSCTKAKSVVKAFHKCRRANGGLKGHCAKRVLGYRCTEKRGDSIPTQYSAKATCKSSSKTVRFAYTQYT